MTSEEIYSSGNISSIAGSIAEVGRPRFLRQAIPSADAGIAAGPGQEHIAGDQQLDDVTRADR